ncbi:Transposon Ty3-I Gag-Pol polyprotein [Vitis vinifera]|uniref:Transposon Ty3-I Gag-Pol polyprotein n=1 Tax=Vitis vinifera TaxID=29760 RepID=A0A438EYX4_VITVI|nr:Transposon Ty3-I Gag-Pol polyprotein [Vitis vinifera]
MLSFLDAFSGYHQIPMSLADEEKTAFITPHDLYYYRVMPFGLKNAGATYQRLMTKIFKPLIGHTVEVYIDDIVVKSKPETSMFFTYNKFFTSEKYAKEHRGQSGSSQGSHRNTTTRNKKELQRLTGKLVALGRFIARFTDELRPFFLAIRKAGTNGWTDNCQNSFERLNTVLCSRPSEQPHPKRKIIHVSGCIGVGNQRCAIPLPLTQGAETHLLRQQSVGGRRNQVFKVELTALALRSAAQKLRPYFQAHPVVVLTNQPLRNILHKPDLIGRMLQWAIELSEFGIEFQPRLSMKGQVMADFVLEYSRKPSQSQEQSKNKWWTLRVDGASRSSGSGVGLLLQSPTGEHLEQSHPAGVPCLQQ